MNFQVARGGSSSITEIIEELSESPAGLTDVGLLREANQDRWGADAEQRLFIVADGVATSNNGELAAAMVCEMLPKYVSRYLDSVDLDGPE